MVNVAGICASNDAPNTGKVSKKSKQVGGYPKWFSGDFELRPIQLLVVSWQQSWNKWEACCKSCLMVKRIILTHLSEGDIMARRWLNGR